MLVKAQGVSKTYRTGASKVLALDGVGFHLSRGELVALVGRSGCGKSTLLNVLAGLLRRDAGDVEICGRGISSRAGDDAAKVRAEYLSIIFQELNLISSLSVEDNVLLSGKLFGSGVKRSDARRCLETVGIGDLARHRPAEISGGQRQRVAFARALCRDAPVLFADEPTSALDKASAKVVGDLLVGYPNENRGAVVVTHDLDLAARASRIVVLGEGRVVDEVSGVSASQLYDIIHST